MSCYQQTLEHETPGPASLDLTDSWPLAYLPLHAFHYLSLSCVPGSCSGHRAVPRPSLAHDSRTPVPARPQGLKMGVERCAALQGASSCTSPITQATPWISHSIHSLVH